MQGSASPPLTTAKESIDNINHSTKTLDDDNANALCAIDPKDETKRHVDPIIECTNEAERNTTRSEAKLEKLAMSQPPSQIGHCGVSDEELEEDVERFKTEVGTLKIFFLNLEKEKTQLWKEVEDGRLSHSPF